jgi:hypothetical protein
MNEARYSSAKIILKRFENIIGADVRAKDA